MAELNYEFRKRMLEVHKKNRRIEKPLGEGQIEITDEWKIVVPANNEFLTRCGRDLEDYFFTSMNIEVPRTTKNVTDKCLVYVIDEKLEKDGTYRIEVTDNCVKLIGKDERAAAQAGYFLEDLMNLEEAPYITIGVQERTPRFRCRMVHSGFSLDVFPNEHLSAIAHQGINIILLYTRAANYSHAGFTDFNDIIHRASLYGLDVYAYSAMRSRRHPEDADAEEFYDNLYGDLFRRCPGLKGIVFVGESIEFPSHDERTSGMSYLDNRDANGNKLINKPNPGWFPCRDFPEWVDMVKKIIRREQPDADIVFWTYNWGYQPEDLRVELIDNLPTDISLQATFEMFEDTERDGVPCRAVDYTLFQPYAGKYFLSEAKAAKRRGIPLYSMTNAAGLTWDVGTIPYEPAPYQWLKRYEAIIDANEKYGLCGTMESHHFGFYPSFISELLKWCFTTPKPNGEEIIDRLIKRDFGAENLDTVRRAYRLFSDALHNMPSTNPDQYGPMRIGPAFPMLLFRDNDIVIPFGEHSVHGRNTICFPYYKYPSLENSKVKETLLGEIRLYKKASDTFLEGAALLKSIIPSLPKSKQDDARRIAGIGEFMGRTALTTHHVKRWFVCKDALKRGICEDYDALFAELTQLTADELANARATLPLVDFDSRLGYEPSMDYMGHREAIEWKIALQESILKEEIPALKAEKA